jgi:hypothetical protein
LITASTATPGTSASSSSARSSGSPALARRQSGERRCEQRAADPAAVVDPDRAVARFDDLERDGAVKNALGRHDGAAQREAVRAVVSRDAGCQLLELRQRGRRACGIGHQRLQRRGREHRIADDADRIDDERL